MKYIKISFQPVCFISSSSKRRYTHGHNIPRVTVPSAPAQPSLVTQLKLVACQHADPCSPAFASSNHLAPAFLPRSLPKAATLAVSQAHFTLRAVPPLPSFIAMGGKSGPLLRGRSRRRSWDTRDSTPCAHTREATCPQRVGTASPPPQQVLTVNWAWPGRDYRGQCTGPCLMETSSQEGELTKRKKEAEE